MQWREPLHPAVHGDVIHLDTALGEEHLTIPIGTGEYRRHQRTASRSHQDESGTRRAPKEPARAASNGDCALPSHPHQHRATGQRNGAFSVIVDEFSPTNLSQILAVEERLRLHRTGYPPSLSKLRVTCP